MKGLNMTETVKMTHKNGGQTATANVPEGAVEGWKAAGWKVAAKPKAKPKPKADE